MEWKMIEEYPRYEINQNGDIREIETKEPVNVKSNDQMRRKEVSLYDNQGKLKRKLTVHRLVAKTFLNVEGKRRVYAIDGDARHANVENLTTDPTKTFFHQKEQKGLSGNATKKFQTVNAETGEVIKVYPSMKILRKDLGIERGSVEECNKNLGRRHSKIRVERIEIKTKAHVELVHSKIKKVIDYLDDNYSEEGHVKFNPVLVDDKDATLLKLQKEMNEVMYG